jgi:hypothetical protein
MTSAARRASRRTLKILGSIMSINSCKPIAYKLRILRSCQASFLLRN